MAATFVKYVVVALISFISAINGDCVISTAGDMTGTAVHLPPLSLPPTQAIWQVTITQPCNVVGVMLKVCDVDSPPEPSVRILSLLKVMVIRNAAPLRHDATADVTVFCPSNSNPQLSTNRVWNTNSNQVWL